MRQISQYTLERHRASCDKIWLYFTGFLTDNYMAVVDKAQKRIFQLSLSENDHNYTAVETSKCWVFMCSSNQPICSSIMRPCSLPAVVAQSNERLAKKGCSSHESVVCLVSSKIGTRRNSYSNLIWFCSERFLHFHSNLGLLFCHSGCMYRDMPKT